MDEGEYIETLAKLLRESELVSSLGFSKDDVDTYRSVGNHGITMRKVGWTVPVRGGPRNPYAGVNVHLECRGKGDFRIDCELFPRRESEAKEDQTSIMPLLEVKGRLATKLRAHASEFGLDRFRLNIKRIHRDPTHPTSCKVMSFDSVLPRDHIPDDFLRDLPPLLTAAVRLIDSVVATECAAQGGSGSA